MPYSYDPIFAADPNNPSTVASNAAITLFNPADTGKAPITITDVTGSPLPNPITVNRNGFGPAFQHATLDRVGWSGGGFTGYFTSYEGMKNEAVAARTAAQEAASTAGAAAAADLAARVAAGQFKGEPGVKGADGSNVLPTQEAIEQAITNPGPAKSAVNTAIAAQSKGEAAYRPANKANGTITTLDTGHPAINFGISPLAVSGGKITHPVIGSNNGGYIEMLLDGPVVESVVDFQFPATTAGRVVIAWPEAEWGNGVSVDFSLVAGLHLVVSRTTWRAESYDGPTQGSANVVYASGTFATPLALNATHRVTAMLDRATNTLRLLLPDGRNVSMTNALLTSKTGTYAVFQLYELGTSETSAAIVGFSASSDKVSATPRTIDVLKAAESVVATTAALPRTLRYNPATRETTATTSGGTVIPNVSIPNHVVPPSGAIKVDWYGHIVMTAASRVYLAVLINGTPDPASSFAVPQTGASADQQYTGPINASFLVTGLTPGAQVTIGVRVLSTVASSTSYRVGGAAPDAFPTVLTVSQVSAV